MLLTEGIGMALFFMTLPWHLAMPLHKHILAAKRPGQHTADASLACLAQTSARREHHERQKHRTARSTRKKVKARLDV
jgi:hypothetical protein